MNSSKTPPIKAKIINRLAATPKVVIHSSGMIALGPSPDILRQVSRNVWRGTGTSGSQRDQEAASPDAKLWFLAPKHFPDYTPGEELATT